MGEQRDVVIIGAGVCGLTAGRALTAAGASVTIVDKGRGPGGRMATRRHDGAVFDHGAQFISVRSAEFTAEVDRWVDAGVAMIWSHGFADGLTGDGSLLTAAAHGGKRAHMPARDGHPRYRGVPSMTAIPKHLAAGHDVRCDVRVESVRRERDLWRVDASDGASFLASTVVLTAPVPQSIALLDAGAVPLDSAARERLGMLGYARCLAVLGTTATAVELPDPGVLRQPVDGIEWIADNAVKGTSPTGPALTIHCAPEWSDRYYESDDSVIVAEVERLLAPILDGALVNASVKRWRYSRPTAPLVVGAWTEGLPAGLILAGDAFMGARVEGAFLSGVAAAAAALSGGGAGR